MVDGCAISSSGVSMSNFRDKLLAAWEGNPPRTEYRVEPMPGTPHIRLLGDGCSTLSLDDFIKTLENDYLKEKGKYFTYPLKSSKTEEDMFVLEGWEVYMSEQSVCEGLVILYYSAMYPYEVIKKYMGETLAAEYLSRKKNRELAINAISTVLPHATTE